MSILAEKTCPSGQCPRRSFSEFALRLRVSGVLAFLFIIGVVFSLLTPQFFTVQNASAIASNAAILSIVAAAQAIVLLTRNVDVSVGSMMGFTAYLTADYASRHPNVGAELVLLALVIGLGLGTINGLLVAYGRVSSLIATLATMSLYRGFTYMYARGQEVTSNKLPRWMLHSVDLRFWGIPALVIVCISGSGTGRDFSAPLSDWPANLCRRFQPSRKRFLWAAHPTRCSPGLWTERSALWICRAALCRPCRDSYGHPRFRLGDEFAGGGGNRRCECHRGIRNGDRCSARSPGSCDHRQRSGTPWDP